MANIFNCIIINNSHYSLKYYGAGDIATAWDIGLFVKNEDKIIDYYMGKTAKVNSFDDFVDFLFIKKIINFKNDVELITREEKRSSIVNSINTLLTIIDKYKTGDVISFINNSYKTIFEHESLYFDINDVTMEICSLYQNGIKDEVFSYLIEEHPYLLICKYSEFQKRIEKKQELVVRLFERITTDKDCKYNLRIVLDILKSINVRKPDLFDSLNHSINNLYDLGIAIANQITEENVLRCERQFNAIYVFFKDIKNANANFLKKHNERINKLLEKSIHNKGASLSYKIPVDNIRDIFEKDIPWIEKIISITHQNFENGFRTEPILNCPPRNKNNLVDFVSTNIPTSDYYTFSHQQYLDIILSVGGLTVLLMLSDMKMFDDSTCCLMGLIEFICNASHCSSNNIVENFQLLIQMLHNIFYSDIQNDDNQQVMRSLCYGTAMYICAFTEKLLRSIYISLKQAELYIPVENATLGQLLSSGNTLFKTILGEYQLKHLNYFFCTDKDERSIGHNYRNRLAHWNEISESEITQQLVSELFYLLISIITSFCQYFSSKSSLNGKEE